MFEGVQGQTVVKEFGSYKEMMDEINEYGYPSHRITKRQFEQEIRNGAQLVDDEPTYDELDFDYT